MKELSYKKREILFDLLKNQMDFCIKHINYASEHAQRELTELNTKEKEAIWISRDYWFEIKEKQSSIRSIFLPNLINQSFLALWATFEETLWVIHKNLYCTVTLGADQSFKKYKPMFEEAKINLSSFEEWEFIMSAARVRNCLLHANGRISLMNSGSKTSLELLIENKNHFFTRGSRMYVKESYVKHCIKVFKTSLNKLILEEES